MSKSKPSFDDQLPAALAPAVDLVHLGRYTMGDRGLELEILMLFVQQAPSTIKRLREAQTERDWREAAHTLKGSARAIGAWGLAQAAEAAESRRGWCVPEQGKAALDLIMPAFAEVQAFIAALPPGARPDDHVRGGTATDRQHAT